MPSKPLSNLVLDEKTDPFALGAMMAETDPTVVKGLDKPKKIVSPENFSEPPPSFTISLDQVKKMLDNVNDPMLPIVASKSEQGPTTNKKQQKHVTRRSRAYSWQFVKNVVTQKDLSIPAPVIEEQPPMQAEARPVVNSIVELAPQFKTSDGVLATDAIEKILASEKQLGTTWREIADETIMELILKGLNAFNFIVALINAYDIQPYDVGLFLATPPDEGTMSLIEEAVCQELLELFREVLTMDDRLLKGLLECRETTEQVEKEIHDMLNVAEE